jgi:predicted nucleotidyltransferase
MRREEILKRMGTQRQELSRRGVKSLRLFGSAARDEASAASDVDFLVAFEATPSYSDFMKLRIFLEDLLGVEVDLVTENGLREGVRPQVEREAIRVA